MGAQFYTAGELADIFDVHVDTIRRWIKSGAIRAIRPGGRAFRIAVDEIERLGQVVGTQESNRIVEDGTVAGNVREPGSDGPA